MFQRNSNLIALRKSILLRATRRLSIASLTLWSKAHQKASKHHFWSLPHVPAKLKLDRFAKEHPSEGDKKAFDSLFDVMVKSSSKGEQASFLEPPACSSETQT